MHRNRMILSVAMLAVLVASAIIRLFIAGPTAVKAQAASLPVGPPNTNWTLTFDDEFNGTAINRAVWRSDYFPNGGNGEMQQYVSDNSHNNYAEGNGVASIIARIDPLNGQPYTSGIIHTKGIFLQKYGFFEMRAQVPSGKGYWPAFWLLPDRDLWVPEIDVTEILGGTPSTTYMTLHYYNTTGAYVSTQSQYTGPDFSAGYHTFAVDWEPNALVWYVDGVERKRTTDTTAIPSEPLFLIANLAVGGNWPGAPDASTVFPGYLNIDYIRVWQQTTAPAPTASPVPPTATLAPTATQVPPTLAPTATQVPPTATLAPTATQVPPTPTIDPPSATPAPVSNNMLSNASFDTAGVSPWYAPWGFRNDLGASFSQDTTTTASSPASLRADLPTANSTTPWVVSVSQANKTFTPGAGYTITFWAKASSARPIHAVIQEQNSPYTEYTNQVANLTTAWTRYTFNFTAPGVTNPAMLNFNLADATGSVWLDQVSLTPNQGSAVNPTATPPFLPTPDVSSPIVKITSPLNNAIVPRYGTVTITANATDNVGVAKVVFLVNNTAICTATSQPYSCTWNVPGARSVTYTLTARAYDTSNNMASASITVKSSR